MSTQTYIELFLKASKTLQEYKNSFPEYKAHKTLQLNSKQVKILLKLCKRLFNTYPTFHPNYIGQMIKPPVDLATLSYSIALFYNSNNHALDGGPETSYLEKEAIEQLAQMIGYRKFLGHLTSGGTMANLEGLWISKLVTQNKKFAICENAHYTHTRLSQVLDFQYELVPMNKEGKMNLGYLYELLKKEKIGTVIATLGTTGLGALDEIDEILKLKNTFNFRLHIDAAYGGYFKILANNKSDLINRKIFDSMNMSDSVVIDPHKHGLQPYGCGSIIFKDPSVGKFYKHDSPYTYFTSKELHLGEVTLECSRPGASAAALWATLQAFPLKGKKGMHNILELTRKASLKFYELLTNSDYFTPLLKPELDIVNYFPKANSTSEISKLSEILFNKWMKNKNYPIYVSKYRLNSKFFKMLFPEIKQNSKEVIILRSVLMKPEHYYYIKDIFEEMERSAKNYFDKLK
ncbi:MAG: pyridoxal-dependent decarboxylase [Ignavibacteria bacterium]|jgi:glutamate/tyrosine decarboxylase-like PLP-dependent enzyme|nr:pyridoxal-dependent decarboxylase [Ignavibacteria bacterium]MDH7528458.1 pyridoxal-dependent decarboxylase [Ignavibacteria bacterium]